MAVGSRPGNLVYLQIDLARALGYFAAERLDMEFKYYAGGTEAASALSSRLVDFSGNSIDHAIRLRALGSDFRMVASFTSLPTVTLVVRHELRPHVRSVRDLAGMRIGVTMIGAGTHVLAAAILAKSGLSLGNVRVVPVGSGSQLVTAMKRNEIDAAMATDPTTTTLLMDGEASILVDLVTFEETQRVFNGEYQFTGLMTRPDVLSRRPDLVQKVVTAIVKTNIFIASHSAADIAAALPAGIVQDRYIFVKGLEHSRPSFSKDGMVTLSGVSNNIQSQIVFGAVSSSVSLDPSTLFDMRFVSKALSSPSLTTHPP
jgi:NitT/TauT family transport system substrate-binding protein